MRLRLLVFRLLAGLVACSSSSAGSDLGGDAGPPSDGGDAALLDTNRDAPMTDAPNDGPPAVDTWANYAHGFFETYCVECHSPALLAMHKTNRSYLTSPDVVRDAALIRCGVAPTALSGCTGSPSPKQFPISNSANSNPKPNDLQRLRLVAWIEAGTKL